MTFERINVERDGSVVRLTLANPARRNVLQLETMREITRALQDTAGSDALAVIIAADGPAFSAGHDFADMVGADLRAARELFEVCTDMMTLIQAVPQVVVAKVRGLATAAGCQLVAACDLALAAETASFATPGGKGGLFCHTPMVAVARAVGRKRGLEMALTGDPIDAFTAAEWGLVNRVVPDDELDAATDELVRRATRGSAYSKAMGKATYYAQVDMAQDQAYRFATSVMAAGVTSADGQEGIRSFVEKRRPTWQNR
ncbi:MAG: enoyl-CoA hydratase-related protein [Acidimicrobiia bacterium]|nr:enoyl-CoA hydratase-related protein [Acidimicrobiia bacterium]